jgi:formaldehyde-activating enzyme involved in methanogenesis
MSRRPTYDQLYDAAHEGIASVPVGGEPWLAKFEAALQASSAEHTHVLRTVQAQVQGLAQAAILETRGIDCARQVAAHYDTLKGALSHAYLIAPESARDHLIDPDNEAQWQVFAAAIEAAPRQQLANMDYSIAHSSMAARVAAGRAAGNERSGVGY